MLHASLWEEDGGQRTAVGDGAKQFRLEEEVAESCRVDAYIRPLLFVFAVGCSIGAGGRGGGLLGGFGGLGLESLLVLLVVDQVFRVVRGHAFTCM
jgi:hypothetical protein